MDQITLEAQQRSALGKKVGALRRLRITPIHVYGPGTPPQTLQADTHVLVQALNDAGFTTPVTVKVDSAEHFVMVREIQRHPVTDRVLHVDLITVSRTERLHAAVPLHFEGESLGAREEGAQVFEDLHELELEALPLEMPSALTVNLELLTDAESVILAKHVELPSNVTLVTDPEASVVRIVHRRVEVEEEEIEAEGEAEAEGEEEPAAGESGEESEEKEGEE
jgi:large subunit ribosomal protein L25